MQQLPSIELIACTGSDVRGRDTIGVERAADCLLTVAALAFDDDDGVVTAALQLHRAAACVTTQMFQHSDSQQWAQYPHSCGAGKV